MTVDESHMNAELEYIFKNSEIDQKSYDKYSLVQIKYIKIILDYVNILKEKAKQKEINDSSIKICIAENEEKNTEYSNIINKSDLESILNEIINTTDNEGININEEKLKELENKSLEQLLKEIYDNNLIDIKSLIDSFISKNYNKIFTNVFTILQSLEKEKILNISQQELISKLSLNDITINEFKDYLLLTKYKQYMKKYNSNKSVLPSLLNLLNNNRWDSFSITKHLELEKEKKIKKILMINDTIFVLDDENIKIYSYKYSELIQTLESRFDNMILNNKKNEIIAKLDLSDFVIFFDANTLLDKKYFFANSNGKKLNLETSDNKIIMSGSNEIYIYSKYKDIYVLEKIMNMENHSNIYQFDINSIIIISGKNANELYQYPIKDYNLIKFKTNINKDLVKINDDIIISYRRDLFNNSYSNILNSKTLKTEFSFKIIGETTTIKSIENNFIMIGTNEKLYVFRLMKNNIIILDKLFELNNNYSHIDYINYINEDALIFCSNLFGKVHYFQKAK